MCWRPTDSIDAFSLRISIPSQAYLDVSAAQNPALSYGADGIVGLGFTSLSTVDALVNHTGASTGRSLLFNAFNFNQSEPNFIAFALQRSSDPNDDVEGSFSIGMSVALIDHACDDERVCRRG